MHHAITEIEVVPPLVPDMGRPGRPSDHKKMYFVGTDDVNNAPAIRDRLEWSQVEHCPGTI